MAERLAPTKAAPKAVKPRSITQHEEHAVEVVLNRRDGSGQLIKATIDLTRGTAVMFPEEGPHAGAGVVARMRMIGQHIESVQEVVTARPVLQSEAELLGEALGSVVLVIRRTYRTAERPVETADIVVPTDRYEAEYVLPVE